MVRLPSRMHASIALLAATAGLTWAVEVELCNPTDQTIHHEPVTNRSDFDPMLAAPYCCVVGEQAPGQPVTFYEDWKKLGRENAKLSKPGLPNYGNSYAYSARAAAVCGVDGGFPRAAEAVKWLEENLPNYRAKMAQNPVWAIVPRWRVEK